MAEDEKNPSIKSNRAALQRQSEKNPIGSHSVRDLYRRCTGNSTSFSMSYEAISAIYLVIIKQINQQIAIRLLLGHFGLLNVIKLDLPYAFGTD